MQSNLVSMAQQFNGLPMDALIGGPLMASARANSAMAFTQTKFMLDTCFAKIHVPAGPQGSPPVQVAAHDEYTPIMINMTLVRGVITPGATTGSPPNQTTAPAVIQNVKTTFNLPLLTIIPLNSLAVETVDITFEMEVKSSFSEEQSESTEKAIHSEGSFEAKAGWGPFSVTVKGSASYDSKDSSTHNTHYEKSNSAKYTVAVHAGQLPLPKGVNTIIEAFTQAITPITMPTT